MTLRRSLLAALVALPACSVLPDRPNVEARRYPLAPARPAGTARRQGRKVLLVRVMRSAPGLDARNLRTLRADGTVNADFYNEWTAPPAELAEDAIRRWLGASGLFSAVVVPGSRAQPDLVLESELTALIAEPAARRARAGLSGVLLSGSDRVLGQFTIEGTAPLAGDTPDAVAAAMVAALAAALAELEIKVAAFS
ncbi:MAG TPA: ABC-type transport auxiliary lipoprotein family protein [Roseomonas sp.]|jgi:ABC-type uncharacterized transport system auxiliary subunit